MIPSHTVPASTTTAINRVSQANSMILYHNLPDDTYGSTNKKISCDAPFKEYDKLLSHDDDDASCDPFCDQPPSPSPSQRHKPIIAQPQPVPSHNATAYEYESRPLQPSASRALIASQKEASLKDKFSQFTAIAKDRTEKWSKIAAEKSAVYSAKAKDILDEAYQNAKDRVEEYKTQNRSPSPDSSQGIPQTGSPTNRTRGPSLIFGESLSVAVSRASVSESLPIPLVVIRCIDYLDRNGLNEVGLYRVSGSTNAVANLKNVFDAAQDLDLVSMEERPDLNAVASLVKMFFRELKEPMLTEKLSPQFAQLLSTLQQSTVTGSPPSAKQDEKLIPQLSQLCDRLPTENYYTLAYLFSHLDRVQRNSEVNKMGTSNLQVVFTPTLGLSSTLIRLMITHWSNIFGKARHVESLSVLSSSKFRDLPGRKNDGRSESTSLSSLVFSQRQTPSELNIDMVASKKTPPPIPKSRTGAIIPSSPGKSNARDGISTSMNSLSTTSSAVDRRSSSNGNDVNIRESSPPLAPRPSRPPQLAQASNTKCFTSPISVPPPISSISGSAPVVQIIKKNPFDTTIAPKNTSSTRPLTTTWNPFGDDCSQQPVKPPISKRPVR
ncbi:hypothetical protein SeLEV6574_g03641 [Synchytrium endobioticum]|uniref:Rho-GAP domain-containing protein n=1 Tax=Synchytrium endobioticum TaxID=286115 RepID=A0A507D3C1_9FUNG|nr:hypothetical protein SeLEV6574_g03641 [Synchytrium endobioticum]